MPFNPETTVNTAWLHVKALRRKLQSGEALGGDSVPRYIFPLSERYECLSRCFDSPSTFTSRSSLNLCALHDVRATIRWPDRHCHWCWWRVNPLARRAPILCVLTISGLGKHMRHSSAREVPASLSMILVDLLKERESHPRYGRCSGSNMPYD